MPGTGEPGHVHSQFGDEHLGVALRHAGDAVQAPQLGGERGHHLSEARPERVDRLVQIVQVSQLL